METKSLLYGLVGFFIGGLLVATVATTFNGSNYETNKNDTTMNDMSMDDMAADLKNKTGDDFDKAFIAAMIVHHQGAIDMAKLSAKNANHKEIKTLSDDIIMAQDKEIAKMKQWQTEWGYSATTMDHSSMKH